MSRSAMPKVASMSPGRFVEVGGIRRAYRNQDCVLSRAACWLVRRQAHPVQSSADVLRQMMLLPTAGNNGIPGNTMRQRRWERLMLASDSAGAYIDVSSFRTALR